MDDKTTDGTPVPGFLEVLGPGKAEDVRRLLSGLTRDQALWLSGYLTALAGPVAIGSRTDEGNRQVAAAGAPRSAGPLLTVLYGTETGNAEGVAGSLVRVANGRGFRAEALDMADFRGKDLARITHLAVVTATHGEGDPPDPAMGFFDFLHSRKCPGLEGVRFSVLALGDSSYVEFCKAGRDLDQRLEELGAERILDRVECDVDFEEVAEGWVERLVEALASEAETGPVPDGATTGASVSGMDDMLRILVGDGTGAEPFPGVGTPAAPEYSRRNPFPAEILESTILNGLQSDKETRHLELALDGSGLEFEPGDSLGIVPENEETVLEAVLGALEASPDALVRIGDEDRPLGDALRRDLELTLVTPGFLTAYAEAAAAEDLRALLDAEDRSELLHFMKCHQVPDVLARYPVPGLEPQAFVDMLRKLQPRLYSIASSPKWMPGQVDLTVAVTRYTPDGKKRNGVASTYLTERRAPGDAVEVFVDRNKGFKLPADPDAPIIMIGAGTGVAPFRSFLQEREEIGAKGRNWLFFGERRFREDFLYQTEWQRFLEDGRLDRMDVAFSRDQAEKVYVQHRVRDRGREVWEWLQEGAFLYVCGDADGMAPGVQAALLDIVEEVGGTSADGAEEYLRTLKADGRYQRDVY